MEKLKAEGHKPFLSREQADALHCRKNPLLSTVARAVSHRTERRPPAALGTQAQARRREVPGSRCTHKP